MNSHHEKAATSAARQVSAEAAMRVLRDVVEEAGELALKMFHAGVRTWTKNESSAVSEADIAVDALLHKRLLAFAPEYGWLSEESGDIGERMVRRRIWLVDPIDGTRSFIKGLPDWAVVAALVEDGRPIAAALHAPVSQELFAAAVEHGATRNGSPIRASAARSLQGARIAGPQSMIERLQHADFSVIAMPRIHSLALRFARVATGEIDAAIAAARSNDWDLAAADLLLHEAHGMLSSFDGTKPVYNRAEPVHGALAAAGAELFPALLAAIGAAVVKTGEAVRHGAMGVPES
jgi:myo-inositol-1(or 4)-monophosphatase